FNVILGLNEKEACEVGQVLGFATKDRSEQGLIRLATEIHRVVPVNTLVVHPVAWALAVGQNQAEAIQGPFCGKPFISTGAGDHFNSGFCLGKLLGLDHAQALLIGVATSGYYVRTGESPSVTQLVQMLRDWPC